MKTYNKEKLNEYAKELFALCLEKNIQIEYCNLFERFAVFPEDGNGYLYSKIRESDYNDKYGNILPIWELIEKVKQL